MFITALHYRVIHSPWRKNGYRFNGGRVATVEHVLVKGLRASSAPFDNQKIADQNG